MSNNTTTAYCTGYSAIDDGTDCIPDITNSSVTSGISPTVSKAVTICLSIGLGLLFLSVPIALIFKHVLRRRYERSLALDPELVQLPELGKYSPWRKFGKHQNDSTGSVDSGEEGGSVMSEVDLRETGDDALARIASGDSLRSQERGHRVQLPRSLLLGTAGSHSAPTTPSPAYTPRVLAPPRSTSPGASPASSSFSGTPSSPLTSAKPLLYELPFDLSAVAFREGQTGEPVVRAMGSDEASRMSSRGM